MSWTYIASLDEYDKQVSKDSSVPDRYYFNRYMYFKPEQYDNWSKGQAYSGIPYTAELVGNSSIPSAGTHLSGSLSNFYVNDVISIKNMSQEEHGEHCSYAKVTIEYENKSKAGGGGSVISYAGGSEDRPPWERPVEDLQLSNQTIAQPLLNAYYLSGSPDVQAGYKSVTTAAGQAIYGLNTDLYIQHLTWTYFERGWTGNYVLLTPTINEKQVTIDSYIIPPGKGLYLPPNYRRLLYTNKKLGYEDEPYTEWRFEIILSPLGHYKEVLNSGTKAKIDGKLQDICSWYVYDPESNLTPVREYGCFS